jgi:hypothetical protein
VGRCRRVLVRTRRELEALTWADVDLEHNVTVLRNGDDASATPPADAITTPPRDAICSIRATLKSARPFQAPRVAALVRLADDFDRLLASIAFGLPSFAVVHEHASSVSSDARGSILRAVYTKRRLPKRALSAS